MFPSTFPASISDVSSRARSLRLGALISVEALAGSAWAWSSTAEIVVGLRRRDHDAVEVEKECNIKPLKGRFRKKKTN